ncbi:tetratricopeptide repeat protein [Sphingomonas sp. 28-63-12]|uniref:tetratricopeptide repeat protein n=1 Tax=Sphingomonas sp. 28-63-12 TaxID=1970434 RepID=UPI000BC9B9E1|nr:MAG: hypothetical protein B7Y47_13770 [Sphingomonas sp. 28-63-12]
MRNFFSALIVTGLLAMPAYAQTTVEDHSGYTEIMHGNFSAAEKTVIKQRDAFPDDADLMLNLAAIYAQTGRISKARSLYIEVLDRADQSMLLAQNRTAWSHDIARRGLQRLGPQQRPASTEITAR